MKRSAQPGTLDTPQSNSLRPERIRNKSHQCFKHSPLNHAEPSIRLMRILEDLSPDGYIQCEIRHASTDSKYICLSYVWGKESPERLVIINEQPFRIRDNLWYFLRAAHRKPHMRASWVWIDALCIDQSNGAERNHQVQQMGYIYSSAERVVSWLGQSERIEEFFKGILSAKERFDGDDNAFYESEYWVRAWVRRSIQTKMTTSVSTCIKR
jgi:hypothetical protein